MLKKISLLFFIFVTNLNSETVDDRNNKNLVNDIAAKIALGKISIEELSPYIQKLPSFLLIFDRNEINIKNTADALATKVIQSHKPFHKLSVKYEEKCQIGTINYNVLITQVVDLRKTLSIPDVESKCVIL